MYVLGKRALLYTYKIYVVFFFIIISPVYLKNLKINVPKSMHIEKTQIYRYSFWGAWRCRRIAYGSSFTCTHVSSNIYMISLNCIAINCIVLWKSEKSIFSIAKGHRAFSLYIYKVNGSMLEILIKCADIRKIVE